MISILHIAFSLGKGQAYFHSRLRIADAPHAAVGTEEIVEAGTRGKQNQRRVAIRDLHEWKRRKKRPKQAGDNGNGGDSTSTSGRDGSGDGDDNGQAGSLVNASGDEP